MHVRTAKAQIRLRRCAVWSGPSLSARRINEYYSIDRCIAKILLRLCRLADWSGFFLLILGVLLEKHLLFNYVPRHAKRGFSGIWELQRPRSACVSPWFLHSFAIRRIIVPYTMILHAKVNSADSNQTAQLHLHNLTLAFTCHICQECTCTFSHGAISISLTVINQSSHTLWICVLWIRGMNKL